MQTPKVFISYSWTDTNHEKWVLDLATGLRHSGIDVVLDKWDLKAGHDAHAFMEKMVSDKEITKVIIVSDSIYPIKSDNRTGGAGTEAQIISSEIYSSQEQDKFVAVVTEVDDNQKPCLPLYYKSRIFIDFTDNLKYAESFEQLLRWIVNKPYHRKPSLGEVPRYILEPEGSIELSTNAAQMRAADAIKNSKEHAYPATKEYFNLLADELEKFRLQKDFDPLSDYVIENLNSFIPYRDEFLKIINLISIYNKADGFGELVHGFFEKIHLYFSVPRAQSSYKEWDFDNFKFFAHELFLHACTVYISERRFDLFECLVSTPYYIQTRAEKGLDPIVSFSEYRHHLRLFQYRNESLDLRRYSLTADMIKERCSGAGVDFVDVMQTDFILFLRSDLTGEDLYNRWYPETLVYSEHRANEFELFQRSRSAKFFEGIRPVLGGLSKKDLHALVDVYARNPESLPRGGFSRLSPSKLLNLEHLCTSQ